jgi:23S rRNA (guanine745-N1)-methyltransferase
VRSCGRPLQASGRGLACAAGHAFDRARSGFVNLLQPQDRRSKTPGDTRAAALARRRLCDAGLERPLHERLLATLAAAGIAVPAVLDVGCGEGSALAWLAAQRPLQAHGVDLSVDAIDLAARRLPEATWVVANADRGLPFADASFDLVCTLLARRPAAELRRVLRSGGALLVAVPGPADLCELRAAAHGRAVARERLDAAAVELAPRFDLVRRERLTWRSALDRPGLDDLLASSYRGARARERERLTGLERLDVTLERDVGWFRPRSSRSRG